MLGDQNPSSVVVGVPTSIKAENGCGSLKFTLCRGSPLGGKEQLSIDGLCEIILVLGLGLLTISFDGPRISKALAHTGPVKAL